MLSSRTGAALAAGIGLGLLLTALIIVIWWTLTQKDRTIRLVRDDHAVEALMASAPYVSLNAGQRPVIIIAPRAAAGLEQWLGADADELADKGREVRAIIVPSGHSGTSEEATVVQLWQSRDIGLLRQWLSMRAEHWTAVGIEPVTASAPRMTTLAEASGFRRSILQTLGRPSDDDRWPLVIWRDAAGQLAVCICDTPTAVVEARRSLGLKGVAPATPVVRAAPPAPRAEPATPETETTDAYPRLGDVPSAEPSGTNLYGEVSETQARPAPVLPGDTTGAVAPSSAVTPPRPSNRTVSRPARPPRSDVNTAAPKAEKDAESLFY